MKIRYFTQFICLLSMLLVCMAGCKDDNNASNLGAVTDITWEPTSGGAIISFVAPQSSDLLYVKAVYTNSQGKEVFNVVSIYGNQIEIEGLADENKEYPVELYAVNKKGGESPVTTIVVKPGRSYINTIYENLAITEIVGGVEVTWENPAGADSGGKTVYVNVNYGKPGEEPETRYLSSSKKEVSLKIRGIAPGAYLFSYQVEDLAGNKTKESESVELTALEEVEIPKYREDENGYRTYIWALVEEQTTFREVYENKNAAIFDGIIDTKENPNDNSYAGTNRDQYGGILPWGSDQMDIVIDLHKVVQLSRIRAWQRAFLWGWSPYAETWREDGISDDYYYYQGGNLKSFNLYGSMDAAPGSWFLVETCDIEALNDLQWGTRDEWYGHTNVWMPTKESYDAALAGHHWELEHMSEPLRYIRVRFTSNWDRSNAEVSGLSELTLYGAIIEEE